MKIKFNEFNHLCLDRYNLLKEYENDENIVNYILNSDKKVKEEETNYHHNMKVIKEIKELMK